MCRQLEMIGLCICGMPRYRMLRFIFKVLNLNSRIQAFGLRTTVTKLGGKKDDNDYSGKKKVTGNFKWRCYCSKHHYHLFISYLGSEVLDEYSGGTWALASQYSVN